MKRPAASLVEYPSSSDEDNEEQGKLDAAKGSISRETPVKKRKLPPLASSLVVPIPVDDPSKHQGRKRTTPHVEGQFAAHVYVSLALRRQSALYLLLQDVLADAKKAVPILHEISGQIEPQQRPELHISVSRPIFLRAHQREDLKRAVRNTAQAQKPFTVSFACLAELTNDEKTRTFLVMEVGAGHHEASLSGLSAALAPTLDNLLQRTYYMNPRYHASIAWALLHQAQERGTSGGASDDSICTPSASEVDLSTSSGQSPRVEKSTHFPAISGFPHDLVSSLNDRFANRLASSTGAVFDVDTLTVKIGKEVSVFSLRGS